MDTLETFRVYRATIPLSFLEILHLYTAFSRFYESLNEENQMCELCMFSQIQSHIRYCILTWCKGLHEGMYPQGPPPQMVFNMCWTG